MEIVVTHNNMDFDALAAQFGITRLHPSVKIVLGQPLQGNVRDFMALYRSSLPLIQVKYLDFEKVTRIFVVDCQHIDRLDQSLKKFLSETKRPPEIIVFDHHDLDPDGLSDIASPQSIIKPAGAATSLVVDELRKAKIKLTQFEATLLALGIYEDTGCLSFSGTTELDARCVAYLLKYGVDLEQVNTYIRPKLNEEQINLLEALVKNARVESFQGAKVVFASYKTENYIEGLANLTSKLLEIVACDAAFCAVFMRDRIHLVGRSDSQSVDVRSVVRKFGGDGHRGAGSAVIKETEPYIVLREVEKMLAERIPPEPTAAEIMISPVRTIRPVSSMEEASRMMLRYGQDGFVVVDEGEVVGIISRRDIDQAMHHKLGHAPVQGFMSRPVISVKAESPLREIQRLMVNEDIGRVPVFSQDGELVGLITRHTLLQMLYGESSVEGDFVESEERQTFLPRAKEPIKQMQFNDKLDALESSVRWLCHEIGRVAATNNMVAYAVGGSVRDLILARANFDLDFVVEGSAIQLAEALEREYPSRLEVVAKHERFQTATLSFYADRKREVDLSTARTEYYEYPAALPTVEPSKLEQDLFRRDFTINALAVCLNPGRYGEMIDHFEGLVDLRKKIIRILHPFSFIEDPTRLVRAARFAARLGFHLENKTKERAKKAMAMGIFDELGGVRLRDELRMILESPSRTVALDLLAELGGCLRFLDTELEYSLRTKHVIRRAERLLERYKVDENWIVYLGLLVATAPGHKLDADLDRLALSNDQKVKIIGGINLSKQAMEEFEGASRSKIFKTLKGQPNQSLAIAACLAAAGTNVRRMIKLYLEELADVSVRLNGRDLVDMGIAEGPQIGKVLDDLLYARLDGTIKSESEERQFVLSCLNTHS
ncbi:MAG: CBS domain-containing protein [Candidatus Melainabacteria bacterium]|mgnify:CR=1 FL=1|nr:CBS domain-containing protein [Candidatus Melainabacteria bacterium]